jgi:hypothetical protein
MDHAGCRTLLLRSSKPLPAGLRLPRFREIDIEIDGSAFSTPVIALCLRDAEKVDLFTILCDDLIQATGALLTDEDAAIRLIERSRRWHLLLRGGGRGLLNEQAQRGLIAELVFLRDHVIDHLGEDAGIAAWHGPFGAAQDFHSCGHRIEVKATEQDSTRSFKVSSEQQLDPHDVDGDRLWLALLEITRHSADSGYGDTLPDFIESIRSKFGLPDHHASREFEQKLLASGYEDFPEYEANRWEVGNPIILPVDASFPSLQGSKLPASVSHVRYTCDLSRESIASEPNPFAL